MGALLSLIISGATVAILALNVLNFLTLNSIQPVLTSLGKLDLRVKAIEEEIPTHATKTEIQYYFNKLETKDNDIVHRLDIISGRLDGINNYLRK